MIGTKETADLKLVSISFSEIFTHHDYMNQRPLGPKESRFEVPYFLDVERINPSFDKVTLTLKISMRLIKGTRIAGFTLKTVYYASTGLSEQFKHQLLAGMLNQSICMITGAWTVQFNNKSICATIPQGYNKFLDDELNIKKTLLNWK